MSESTGNVLFPVFLKLHQIHTLVVGGGNVGLEKVEALLKNDPHARLTLIAPEFKTELLELAATRPLIEVKKRKVRNWDLRGKDLLILATDDYQLHVRLKKRAAKRHLLTNVADTPDLCDFYLGSTVKKGDLKIGISTNGQSPTFAKRLREVLEESLPDSTPQLLNQLKRVRDRLKGDFSHKVKKLNELTAELSQNDSYE